MNDRRRPAGGSSRGSGGTKDRAGSAGPPKRARATKLQTGLWLLAAAVAALPVGFSLLEDPGKEHYENARRMVTSFEIGKEPANIAYENVVYQEALSELDLVPIESSYHVPARDFAEEIRGKIDAYRRRREEMELTQRANFEKSRRRREILYENQRRTRLDPEQTSWPECNDVREDNQ
jgi:hypothetical protein